MGSDTASIGFSCKCGGKLETKDAVGVPASIVACKNCGEEIGTWADIKDAGMRKLREKVVSDFRKAFKRR